MATDQLKLLIDDDGNLRTWKDFKAESLKLDDTYNKRWLKTEYDTAVAQSNMASRWQEFQKDKDLYPNLKYNQIDRTSKNLDHVKWDGLILPLDHKFWDTHLPPNDWGCGCDVEQTDEEADEKDVKVNDMPANKDAFNINPGKQGKVVDNNHPYFKVKEFRPVAKKANVLLKKHTRKELAEFVRTELTGEYTAKGVEGSFKIANKGVNETLAKNIRKKDWYTTLNYLYKIEDLIKLGKFEFEAASKGTNEIIGMYKANIIIESKTYELGIRKTLEGNNFYYLISRN